MSREIKFRAWDTILNKMLSMKEIERSGMNLFALCEGVGIVKLIRYTGLKDINGVEIYEGDILIIPSWSKFKRHRVVFEYGMFRAVIGSRKDDNYSRISLASFQGEIRCEVVGNIYEDPKLIKEID